MKDSPHFPDDGVIQLQNPHLQDLETDYLYHLGLDTSMDLKSMFGDVKYVCMGGSADRAEVFAHKVAQTLQIPIPEGALQPIGKTERFSLYKVGPVVSVNHGMGIGSVEICLNEMAKLMSYAQAKHVRFLRLGTSGGIGVPAGTVVITNQAYDDQLRPYQEKSRCGTIERRETTLNAELAQRIYDCRGEIHAVIGATVAASGFYEPQGRLDGAICDFGEEEKMRFLENCDRLGIRNMEMEATEFAAFTNRLSIPSAIICSTLLNRLEGDQVTSTPGQLAQFADYSQQLALRFIENEMNDGRK